MSETFYQRAIKAIKEIPAGCVSTYGTIAAMAGSPRAARQVVRILHTSSKKEGLPWHRVVNAKGEIALKPGQGFEMQKAMLEGDGIKVDSAGKIDLEIYGWPPPSK